MDRETPSMLTNKVITAYCNNLTIVTESTLVFLSKVTTQREMTNEARMVEAEITRRLLVEKTK